MNELKERSKRLFQKAKVDAVALKTNDLFPDSSVSYFSGIPKHFLGGNLLLMRPGRMPLLLKSVLEPKVSQKGLRVKRIDKKKQLASVLKKELKGVKKVGVNKPLHTYQSLSSLKKAVGKKSMVGISKKIAEVRAVKSESEIESVSRACEIAEKAAFRIPGVFRKGMAEKELALEIELFLREKGENILPFPVIVASGKNASFPHHVPGNTKIRTGLLLADFGACHKTHCSDITRVFSVGSATKKQRSLYAGVFAAKQFGQSLVKAGAVQGKVFEEVGGFLKKETGFKLVHGLGHGLGVDAHDFPRGFLQGNKEKLSRNMVLTVEPGIYGKFGGIRIEDDVVVSQNACRPLSKAPAELICL